MTFTPSNILHHLRLVTHMTNTVMVKTKIGDAANLYNQALKHMEEADQLIEQANEITTEQQPIPAFLKRQVS